MQHHDDSATVSDALAAALADAFRAPERDDAWDLVEEMAAGQQAPERVAAIYREVLQKDLGPELGVRLGQRAVRFHDEWLEDPTLLVTVLSRVLDFDPEAEWAFQRLSLLYTVAERWDDLLAFYDKALERTTEKSRRFTLLDEAAHVAKDFAGQADRAIRYLEQLFPLKPSDAQLAASLERLFEKQHRYNDLINLWTARLKVLPADAARTTRARIAACWLDHLGRPDEALSVTEALLEESPDDAVACGLFERIAALDTAAPEVRRRALELLKQRYDAAGRVDDVIRVLGVALSFAERDERIRLHPVIAEQLIARGNDVGAIDQYAALLTLVPGDAAARDKLRAVTERTERHDRYADALAAAADACADAAQRIALLTEAAHVRCDVLRDEPGAIALHARVIAEPEVDAAALLASARKLSELLERAERSAEQLDVLERLAGIEPDEADRRATLGKAARLADRLNEFERALAAWERRVTADAADREALDATVDLLDRYERWEPLVAALRRRAAGPVDDAQRRADLVRVARLYADPLGQVDAAIKAWSEVQEAFGEDEESVDALAALLGAAARWKDLVNLLKKAAQSEKNDTRRADLRRRLGDVYREQLDSASKAVKAYREALEADPHNEGARAGLTALLENESTLANAVEALARAYAATDEWQRTLSILERRLAAAGDAERTAILLEAAKLQEERASDPAAALVAVRRAMPLAPADTDIERELLRLAETTGHWSVAVEAYADAIGAAGNGAKARPRVAQLRFQQGSLLETKLDNLADALEAYTPVISLEPARVDASDAVIRVAGRLGRWDAAAGALVGSAVAREGVELALFDRYAEIAAETDGWNAALRALESAAVSESAAALKPAVARDIEARVAVWHRDRRHDAAAAEAALLRAVAHDNNDAATLHALAELQRRAPGRPLVDTLLRIADVASEDPAALHEAATVALERLPDDAALARTVLLRLRRAAADRWTAGGPGGRAQLEWYVSFAQQNLVATYTAAGEHAAAVDLLVEGAALPFAPTDSRAMRHAAAEIAAARLSDAPRAIGLYRGILAEAPDDARAIAGLAALYEAGGMLAELLELRRHELGLTTDAERRLALRLDIARVQGVLGERDARISVLRDNLGERPGHPDSIREITALLEGENRHGELADLLADQAGRLEEAGAREDAAALWARVAHIAETNLADIERALDAHRRVVALAPTVAALDALARLHVARGEHVAAVGWLEQRLARTEEPAARAATVVRLAQAHLGAHQRDRALAVLENALGENPDAHEVRTLLAEQYRLGGNWEPLAALLARGADHAPDPATRLAYLREAGEIHHRRLGNPEAALGVLEQAVALAPAGDRTVRTALADALRAAGRLDDARRLLEALVEEFGRRRPPERAAVHFSLAQIARARGDLGDALAQLEMASAMDVGHAGILRMLGELARESGQLERAERAYRALLMIVRRQQPGGVEAPDAMGPSEVHYELHRIAQALGQEDRAREILESAFEAASQNDVEARRFERSLRTGGNAELLMRVLRARLERTTDDGARALILADLGDVLADPLARFDEALDARLEALAYAPSDDELQATTCQLALKADKIERYAERLGALADAARDRGEMPLAADLYLRLGAVVEEHLGTLGPAGEIYQKAEATGEHQVRAWRALDRVYGSLGDTAGQIRVLRQYVNSESEEIDAEEKTSALYRLAELEIESPDHRDEGVEMLSWALDREPRYEQAATVLERVAEEAPDHERVIQLYERVARASGSDTMLLDALERSAALPGAGVDVAREAVELATRLEDHERAEALLRRAIENARNSAAGLADAVWALVALGGRRKAAQDWPGALAALREAAEVADPAEAYNLLLEVAQIAAGPAENLQLAAETYEKLRERDITDRAAWEPLLEIYRRLGDQAALERLIATTIESVFDSGERNKLRVERARLLLGRGAEGEAEAITTLRDVLDEDPDSVDAGTMLMDIFERTGRDDDLAALMSRQLDSAKARADGPTVATISLRLGGILERGQRRDDAMDVYKSALATAPDSVEVLRALVRLYGPDDDANDRADAMEKLLRVERDADAAKLATELVALRESLSDEPGVERALDLGFRAAPTNDALRERLVRWYTEREDYLRLAELLVFDAEQRKDKRTAVARLREAAALYREKLGDGAAAAQTLGRARELAPTDVSLLGEHARALADAGETPGAIEQVTAALDEGNHPDAVRADLLRVRADLRMTLGEGAEAVADLEQAYVLGGSALANDLTAGLDRLREAAEKKGDRATERAMTMRLSEVLTQSGDGERARTLLAAWAEREPTDREVLRQLVEMDSAAGNWDAVAETYRKLVDAETGTAKVDAALRLFEACERAGRPGDARAGLEQVFAQDGSNEQIRGHLRKLYEQTGAHRELAALSLEDARQATNDGVKFDRLKAAGELLLRSVGDAAASIAPLEEALGLRAGDHELTLLLADAYTAAERIQEATSLLETAIAPHKGRRSRELATLQHRMARVAAAAGDRAVELAWLNVALDCDMQNGPVASELADVAIELGQHEIALKALRAVTLMKSPGPMTRAMAFLRQGQIALQQGDQRRAVFLAKKAQTEDPALGEAQRFLKELGE